MSKSFAENLKQLRQQKGFTQEQVANQLHITYQAVSKWETGVANPDLSLIVPLAQLLSVSTDTLLGAFEQQNLSRQEELITELKKITNWNKDGRAQKLEIAQTLIKGFPNTPDANYWYACCVYDYLEYDVPEEEKKHYLLLAEKHFRAARESAEYQNASAVSFVTILSRLGKKEEAIALSQKQTGETKRKCLSACLNKEERERYLQDEVYNQAMALLRTLYDCRSEEAFLFANEFLKLLYPIADDAYYQELCVCYNFRARSAIEKGQCDKAMDHFALCAEYAMKAADYLKEHQIKADTVTPCPTHPLFARRTFDHELYLQDNPHEMVYCFVTSPNMKVLFERADHQALVSELQKRMNAFDPFNEKN